MTAKITRKEALKIALYTMQRYEVELRKANTLAQDSLYRIDGYKAKKEKEYQKLTAAMQIIEGMARQKELL